MKAETFKHENNLEALRGYAAVFVVIQHVISNRIDANYHPTYLDAFIPPGNLCVLVFFMLSGYVIGISNKNNLIGATIGAYIKKRFVRIYPIYFISLLLGVLVTYKTFSLSTTICNFALLQDLLSPVLTGNGPVWSLHYEVVYYLLFIPISYFNINPVLVFILSIVLSFVNYFLYPHLDAPILSTYLNGLSFWIMGLIIAKYFKTKDQVGSPNLLMCSVFLILAMKSFHITSTIFNNVTMHFFKHYLVFPDSIYWAKIKISFSDLMFFPYCFIFITVFSNINFKFKKAWMVLFQLLPILCIYTFVNTYSADTLLLIIVSSVCYLISTFLFFSKSQFLNTINNQFIKAGKWLGNISYGIYIIHYPILMLFSGILFFSGSVITFIVRLALFIPLVIGASFFLEKKFQTWIKGLFYK